MQATWFAARCKVVIKEKVSMKKVDKEADKPGKGQKTHVALDFIMKFKTPEMETEQEIKGSYDLEITIEHVDYLVRNVAGSIARVASKLAEDGINGGAAAAAAAEPAPAAES
jgi:hypothetical protein